MLGPLRREMLRRPWSLLALAVVGVGGAWLCTCTWLLLSQIAHVLSPRLSGQGALFLDVAPRSASTIAGIGLNRPVLTAEDLAYLRQQPGVTTVQVLQALPIPATVQVRVPPILDNEQFLSLYSLPHSDLPPHLNQLRTAWAKGREADGAVPVLINPQVLHYYNLGMADRYGLPRLDPNFLQDRRFQLLLGRDPFAQIPGAFVVPIRVAGFDDVVNPWGMVIPEVLGEEALLRLFPKGRPAGAAAMQVRMHMHDASALAQADQALRAAGFSLGRADPLADAAGWVSRYGPRGAWLLSAVFAAATVLAAASLGMGLVGERLRSIALWRQCGANSAQVLVLCVGGPCLTLAVASGCGALLAQSSAATVWQQVALAWGAPPWPPADGWLPWRLAGLGGLCALGGCLVPALSAVRRPLLSLLRSL